MPQHACLQHNIAQHGMTLSTQHQQGPSFVIYVPKPVLRAQCVEGVQTFTDVGCALMLQCAAGVTSQSHCRVSPLSVGSTMIVCK
jgi:hypothetical protein